jgi:hypothetical protein
VDGFPIYFVTQWALRSPVNVIVNEENVAISFRIRAEPHVHVNTNDIVTKTFLPTGLQFPPISLLSYISKDGRTERIILFCHLRALSCTSVSSVGSVSYAWCLCEKYEWFVVVGEIMSICNGTFVREHASPACCNVNLLSLYSLRTFHWVIYYLSLQEELNALTPDTKFRL